MAMAASATTGGVLSPPLSIAAFPKHNLRICQKYSIAAFPKQNLRISPSKFSISAVPKHNLRISPSKFNNRNRNRGSLFRSRCSSKIAELGTGGMMNGFKSMIYQIFKQLIAAIKPPSVPQYYRIINLEDLCDEWLRIQVEEDEIWEMLVGDLCRKFMLNEIAQSSVFLVDRCICSRSIVCFCYNKLSEQLPVFLGHPSLFYVGNNSEDTIDGFEFQLQISVDGEKSDESICTSKNLEHFLQQLMALKGKYYAVTVSHRSIKLDKKMVTSKIDGVRNYSNILYKKCI